MPKKVQKVSYHCSVCDKSSGVNTIACETGCGLWVHRTCVPLTEKQFSEYAAVGDYFLCPKCVRTDGCFDYDRCLRRIQKAPAAHTCSSERRLLQIYGACPCIEKQTNIPLDDGECSPSKQILEMYSPIMLEQYSPRAIEGDGNCLYRAVSLALFGTQGYHTYLRIVASMELIENRRTYDVGNHDAIFADCLIPISDYGNLVQSCTTDGTYAEIAHIYVLSGALGFSIQSYMPPTTSACFGSSPYTVCIAGRGVRRTTTPRLAVMWMMLVRPQTMKDFQPNHFVLLAEKCTLLQTKQRIQVECISEDDAENSKERCDTVLTMKMKDCDTKQTCRIGNGKIISLSVGDITQMSVDVIVNAANETLNHAGGVARAIAQAAGAELLRESSTHVRLHGELKVTNVAFTTAGRLPSQKVLHAVGPRMKKGARSRQQAECEAKLRQTISNCVSAVSRAQYRSMAIPAISSGIFGCPKNMVAKVLVNAIINAWNEVPTSNLKEVHIVDIDANVIKMAVKCLHEKGYKTEYVNKICSQTTCKGKAASRSKFTSTDNCKTSSQDANISSQSADKGRTTADGWMSAAHVSQNEDRPLVKEEDNSGDSDDDVIICSSPLRPPPPIYEQVVQEAANVKLEVERDSDAGPKIGSSLILSVSDEEDSCTTPEVACSRNPQLKVDRASNGMGVPLLLCVSDEETSDSADLSFIPADEADDYNALNFDILRHSDAIPPRASNSSSKADATQLARRVTSECQSDSEGMTALPFESELSTKEVIRLLETPTTDALKRIPHGLKNNAYCIINDTANAKRRANGEHAVYTDDCDAWSSEDAHSTVHHYFRDGQGTIKRIWFLVNQNKYCRDVKKMVSMLLSN